MAIQPCGVSPLLSARGRNRTGTELPPRDFKSLVSTNSTTRAVNRKEYLSVYHTLVKWGVGNCFKKIDFCG